MKGFLCLLLATSGCTLYFGGASADGDTSPPSLSADAGPPTNTTPRRIFVPSSTFKGGGLGGHVGADWKCQQHADAALLGGVYKAWLSSTTKSPLTFMPHETVPYTLVDGTLVANDWDDLVDGEIHHAINLDETGAHHTAPPSCMLGVAAWTNTWVDGRTMTGPGHDYSCGGWMNLSGYGALGNVEQWGTDWTDDGCYIPCTSQAALYCVEQ